MTKTTDEFSIFYAWQSDRPGNHCRHLIREALDEAVESVNTNGNFPFTVTVTSDTQGETGLCDIPAVILEKINDADAALVDLTFVAQTTSSEDESEKASKSCPNPNVLFELGYAFKCVSPERIVAVMNTAYGPASKTLFDINHRRHPISYKWPDDDVGSNRKKIVEKLSKALACAIEGIAALGPRGPAGNSDRLYDDELREITASWRRRVNVNPDAPTAFLSLKPASYLKRRFQSYEIIEDIVRRVAIPRHGHNRIDLQPNCDPMGWGVKNYNHSTAAWAISYSGLLWVAIDLSTHADMPKLAPYRRRISSESAVGPVGPGQWIDFVSSRDDIRDVFWQSARFVKELYAGEKIHWDFRAINLENRWLGTFDPQVPVECSRRSAASEIHLQEFTIASQYKDDWMSACASSLVELFSLFDQFGRRYEQSTAEGYLSDWSKDISELP